MFSEDLKEQLEMELSNARKIIAEIFEIRERKIILMAVTDSRTNGSKKQSDNMLSGEAELYDSVKKLIISNKDSFLKEILTPSKQEIKQKVLKTMRVRILEEIPPFVWEDEKTYGPYKEDAVTELPDSIGEFLVDNNKAAKENETTKEREQVLPEMQDAQGAQDSQSESSQQELSGKNREEKV